VSEGRITLLLRASSEGNRAAEEELIPLVYDELRRLAASYMRRERPDHTLQPTALVHEAYLKLVGQKVDWKNRSHFFGLAAQQMRRVLVSHARRHRAAKRGGGNKVSFDDALEVAEQQPRNMIAIDDLLKSFAVDYPRQAKVVDLRFFGGNTEEEVAEILGVAPETVIRDWKFAKTWLSHEIRSGHENDAR
jgi:RNA polymerase sigma factor (TIGR02999 family)